MTLAFLALLGAPYIYDISSLRVNNTETAGQILTKLGTEKFHENLSSHFNFHSNLTVLNVKLLTDLSVCYASMSA